MPEIKKSPRFERIVLKLSGESLMGNRSGGIDAQTLKDMASEIQSAHRLGVKIGVVMGGGNIFRGITSSEYTIGRVTADYMGMLGTVINALALREVLESIGTPATAMSALSIDRAVEPYTREKALTH
ncbi:MAG: UMP kinase, partial [Deltaproteobacteria bacterium]